MRRLGVGSIAAILAATATPGRAETWPRTIASDVAPATPVAGGSEPRAEQPPSLPRPPSKSVGIDALVGLGLLDLKFLSDDKDEGFVLWLGAGRRWDGALAAHVAWVGGGAVLLGLSPFALHYDLQLRGGLRFGSRNIHVIGFAATGGDGYGIGSGGGDGDQAVALGGYGCGGSSARLGGRVAVRAEAAWCIRTGDEVDHEARFEAGIELGSWNLGLHLTNYYLGNESRLEAFSFFAGKAI